MFPTFPSLHLRHSPFSNPSVTLPTSQLILQPFRCLTYVAAHSPTLLSLLLHHMLFSYVTWRAAYNFKKQSVRIEKIRLKIKLHTIQEPNVLYYVSLISLESLKNCNTSEKIVLREQFAKMP